MALSDPATASFRVTSIDPDYGFFDDPTLGGVILDTNTRVPFVQDINQDNNVNGVADILE